MLKKHETWWEINLGKPGNPSIEHFRIWMGDPQHASRKFVRQFIPGSAESFLDVGCGACPEYFGLKEDGFKLRYVGVDITPKLVKAANEQEIDVYEGSINKLPFVDDSFDVVHTRHVLEHLSGFEQALNELIRVAKQVVLISFFITPINADKSIIHLDDAANDTSLYHNVYSIKEIEKLLDENKKVGSWAWQSKDVLEIAMKEYE